MRMDAPHLRQQRREDVQAHRHAANQPHAPVQRLLLVTDGGDGVLKVLKHPVTELQERFAGGSDPDAAADAVKDRLAEFFFEQQDLPADRRLRDVELRPGRGEGAAVGNGADDLELAQVHAPSDYMSRAHRSKGIDAHEETRKRVHRATGADSASSGLARIRTPVASARGRAPPLPPGIPRPSRCRRSSRSTARTRRRLNRVP